MTAKTRTASFMAMKGEGDYAKATGGAKHVIDGAAPIVSEAVERMELADDGTAFRVADMGAADGGTSIDLWRAARGQIRESLPSRPIEMIYTDLPGNDFPQLFRMIHGQSDVRSYYGEIENLYVFASATFHRPILPPNALDLGFSATASHYISSTPRRISDRVHMVGASGEARAAFERQGAED